jgi:hypothetical protein
VSVEPLLDEFGLEELAGRLPPEADAFADRVLGIRDGRVPEAHADILRP